MVAGNAARGDRGSQRAHFGPAHGQPSYSVQQDRRDELHQRNAQSFEREDTYMDPTLLNANGTESIPGSTGTVERPVNKRVKENPTPGCSACLGSHKGHSQFCRETRKIKASGPRKNKSGLPLLKQDKQLSKTGTLHSFFQQQPASSKASHSETESQRTAVSAPTTQEQELCSLSDASPSATLAPRPDSSPTGTLAPRSDSSPTGTLAPPLDSSPTGTLAPPSDSSPTGTLAPPSDSCVSAAQLNSSPSATLAPHSDSSAAKRRKLVDVAARDTAAQPEPETPDIDRRTILPVSELQLPPTSATVLCFGQERLDVLMDYMIQNVLEPRNKAVRDGSCSHPPDATMLQIPCRQYSPTPVPAGYSDPSELPEHECPHPDDYIFCESKIWFIDLVETYNIALECPECKAAGRVATNMVAD